MRRRLATIPLLLLVLPAAALAADCPRGEAPRLREAGELALARGDAWAAARWLACAAARSDDAALAGLATRVAFEHGHHARAVAAARRWLELSPDHEPARRHLALSLLRGHDDVAAGLEFAKLLDTAWEDRARGYLGLLGILAGEANTTGAARLLARLAAADSAVAEAHYAQSVLWQRAEHGRRALAAARQALALRPGWRDAELAEVRALATLGRGDEALARIAALAADGDAFTRLSQGWMLAAQQREAEAAAVFGALRRDNVAVAEALEGLGVLALDQRRLDDAERLFTELAQHARSADSVFWYLGRVAEARGQPVLAVRYLERVTSGGRADAAQLRAHRLAREAGYPERAELQLAQYLSGAPTAVTGIVSGLASQRAEAGDAVAGIALLGAALARRADPDLRLARSFLLERDDQVAAAIADMRAVLLARPGDPSVLNALGYTLVDRTDAVAEGHRLIARALEARPDSFAIIDSMGWALVRLGRPAEGLPWLEDAWRRSRDPEIAAHLGETLWLLGRPDEGRKVWQDSLQQHPDNPVLLRAIARRGG